MAQNQKYKPPRLKKYIQKKGVHSIAKEISNKIYGSVRVHNFKVDDGYHQKRHRIERQASKLLASKLESYLAKRPHLDFNHPSNRAKKLLYSLPTFPEWFLLMPGAQALEPVHDPEQKHLTTKKRIDPITRRLFRHGPDAIAIRARTVMAGWIAHDYVSSHQKGSIHWLSLAGGTSVPTMLMIEASGIDKRRIRYANIDQDSKAIEIAREITAIENLDPSSTNILTGDVFDEKTISVATNHMPVDIIDMMGIFEYLDREQSIKLLISAYGLLKKGGIIITCNMRSDHSHLNLHKRGIGWPDVRPRTVEDLIELVQEASIPKSNIDIYHTGDGIYHVLKILKS